MEAMSKTPKNDDDSGGALDAFEAFDREFVADRDAAASPRTIAPDPDRYAEVLEVAATLNSTLDLTDVLNRIVDAIIRVTDCERGFLMLKEPDGSFSMHIGRTREHGSWDEGHLRISRTIVDRVVADGKPFIESNLAAVESVRDAGSIHEQAIRSAICLPLRYRDRLVGVIYADSGFLVPHVLESDHRLLDAFAAQAAIAIANAREHGELMSGSERLERQNLSLRKQLSREVDFSGMVSKNERMLAVFDMVAKIASHDINVLIQGESGTGKELLARAIHQRSPRHERPFETVNCAGIPAGLVESILFGHCRGAFTGAVADKQGVFELADQGTLFLDEIGDMPLSVQPKILRAVQEGEIRRVGEEERVRHVDVRIIAATNIDLRAAALKGTFREDLYFRLNVANVHLPPLRDRREDIVPLAEYFLRQWAGDKKKPIPRLGPEVGEYLTTAYWKGNVRQLKSAVEWGIVFQNEKHTIEVEHLRRFFDNAGETASNAARAAESAPHGSLRSRVAEYEAGIIRDLLRQHGYNITSAAKALDISRQQLHNKLRRYGIDPKRPR